MYTYRQGIQVDRAKKCNIETERMNMRKSQSREREKKISKKRNRKSDFKKTIEKREKS